MKKNTNLVVVGERQIVQWRLDERPDKTIPICGDEGHDCKWDEKGETLRCRKCGLDCT